MSQPCWASPSCQHCLGAVPPTGQAELQCVPQRVLLLLKTIKADMPMTQTVQLWIAGLHQQSHCAVFFSSLK